MLEKSSLWAHGCRQRKTRQVCKTSVLLLGNYDDFCHTMRVYVQIFSTTVCKLFEPQLIKRGLILLLCPFPYVWILFSAVVLVHGLLSRIMISYCLLNNCTTWHLSLCAESLHLCHTYPQEKFFDTLSFYFIYHLRNIGCICNENEALNNFKLLACDVCESCCNYSESVSMSSSFLDHVIYRMHYNN